MPDETTNGTLLELKLTGEIAGSFRVGRYQRGYRWGTLEVERLLNDIWESKGSRIIDVGLRPRLHSSRCQKRGYASSSFA